MNTILKRITTECHNFLEENLDKNDKYFDRKIGKYEIYYSSKTKRICHYYYGHKIFVVDLVQRKITYNYCGYTKSRITKAQINFLLKFYEYLDFIVFEAR